MPPRSRLTRVRARLNGESGYTLPEVLVVLSIVVIVVSSLAGVFVAASNAEARANLRFRAQLQARVGLNKLRREVHCASAATVSTTSLTLTLPTPPTGTTACPTGVGQFTWCTIGSGTRWQLDRIAGATCTSTGAVKWADYLTSANIFPSPTYTAPTTTSLGKVHVDLSVNISPSKPGTYRLVDNVVLRNTVFQ